MLARMSTVAAMALLAVLIAVCFYIKPAETLPGGFSDTKVTDSHLPTALDFTPDGRMLVTSKTGELYVYDGSGNRLANPALDLPVCASSERGLLGVAVDPNFEANKHIYLYYTHMRAVCPAKEPGNPRNPYNRVSRFTMSGDTMVPNSEKVLIDGIPSPNGNHNGGDLHFGNDDKLYVSVGDGAYDVFEPSKRQYENDVARDDHVLLAKILRINPDGTIPADNPYADSQNSARCSITAQTEYEIARTDPGDYCKETFVKGFRNPFRFAVDYDDPGTRLFINDVGGQRWEEVDEARFGADNGNDYGWNICEGRHDNVYRSGQADCDGQDYTGPIHEYNHDTGCESITAGAFVPDSAEWPKRYDGAYLYGDFVCGKVYSLTAEGGDYRREMFLGGLGLRSAVAMGFGPYKEGKALYYASFEDGGMIRRVAYTEGNQPPAAEIETVGENYGPLTMDFDASQSRDPDGNEPLSYTWDFDGDGTVDQTTDTATVTHTYAQRGKYTVSLTVEDGLGEASEPARIDVFPGDAPPEPVIDEIPTEFQVGQPYTASGTATDPDDAEPTLSWEVVQVHDNNHEHPADSEGEPQTSPSLTFDGPPSEGLFSTDPGQNYLEVRLTATDSLGLSRTVSQAVRPQTVQLTFQTQPADLKVSVFGEVIRGERTVTAWVGDDLRVVARRQRDRDGHTWGFGSWSDGGSAEHVIDAPENQQTYKAMFQRLRR